MPSYDDMAIPEIKLVQNTGGDEAKQLGARLGDFYCSITQEVIPGNEGFEVIVSGLAQKTRTYWGTTEIRDEPPVCSSPDGITSVNGDDCKKGCPYQVFNDAPYLMEATERRMKCNPSYHIVAIKASDMMPVLIRCSGISSMAAKELNTLLTFHKAIRGQYHKAKIRVSSIKKRTAYGDSYAIKFGSPVLITDAQMLADAKEQLELLTGVEVRPEPEQIEQAPAPQLAQATEAKLEPEPKPEPPRRKPEASTPEPPPEHREMPDLNF